MVLYMSYSFQIISITPEFAYAPDGRGPDSPEPLAITIDGVNLYGQLMQCEIGAQATVAMAVWISDSIPSNN